MTRRTPLSIARRLEKRKSEYAFRKLFSNEGMVDFCSNDYLGVSRVNFAIDARQGATGSRLIAGNTQRTVDIESQLAVFFGQPAALLFNSGYGANLGFFSSIPQRGDTVVYDALIHASIRDGIRLGAATHFSFRHNDMSHLREKLSRAKGTCYVAVESLYSMDGDRAPLVKIAQLCEEVGAYLVVDEAHAGGIFGKEGKGLVSFWGLDERIFCKIITFGKAYGSHGAVVLGSALLKDCLVNFSRPFIYTTAPTPHTQERIFHSVGYVARGDELRERLVQNIRHFRHCLSDSNRLMESDSPIQSLLIAGNRSAKAVEQSLREQKFAVKAILSPTVPRGKERIRICIHAHHTFEELNRIAQFIHEQTPIH